MKVCLLCGESYGDAIDFCFRDGEVLASGDGRQTPILQPRSFVATPTPSLAAAGGADEDPDVARANRRALMRAAAATYLAPGQGVAKLTPSAGAPREAEAPRPTPVPMSRLDQGLPQWDEDPDAVGHMADGEEGEFDEPFEGPPSRTGVIAAALIGALVVVAIALGVGLLVVVGLGRKPAGTVTTTAMVERPVPIERTSAHEPDEREAEVWSAPTPEPLLGQTPPPAPPGADEEETPAAAAVEVLVSLDTGGASDGALLLHVDGVPQGVMPARVLLTPGDHVFRVVNGHSGTEMLQVTRTIDATAGTPGATRELDLSR